MSTTSPLKSPTPDEPPLSAAKDPDEDTMPLLSHLNELRKRLTWAAVGVLVTTILSFFFAREILLFLLAPYGVQLQTLSPTEGLETFFKVSLMTGVVLAMPFILLQLWIFIESGLEENEKRYVYIFIPSALGLFLLGILFAWFILVPAAVSFLSTFMPDVFATEWTGSEYISFILAMLFWLGVSFEMPIIMYFLARVGLLEPATLAQQWRMAVVGIAVLAAMITPSIDPVTMLLTMAPLLVLYVFSIGLAKIGKWQFAKSMAVE